MFSIANQGSAISLFVVYKSFPEFEGNELEHLKLPRSIEDAKHLGQVLSRYKDDYYFNVLSGVFITYIFLQTFAIPGSIFLSIMSGFLFSFYVALFLVCFCSATGATCCYMLSQLVGRKMIFTYFPEKAEHWRQVVDRHRGDLLNYMIFLRITPFLPNWFINITAPVVGVPILPFWLGTFLGVAPPSFVAIQTGTTLHELASSSAALSWTSLIILLILGFVSLVPILIKYNFLSGVIDLVLSEAFPLILFLQGNCPLSSDMFQQSLK
ncbi:unnamed protein product [Allacma fusca]|uniref:VTT domain-containing protein n=1 Tax=Allacma fusca TaxID=39272 RepID=A0A8J2PRI2_9HEXA|nr:unnamed protein product [Allacma fusca]